MTTVSPPEENNGAGRSCHTSPAPLKETTTLPSDGGRGKRPPHSIPAPTHDGAARPLRVEYHQSRALGPDECRRRIRLAYAYVLGTVPWPDDCAAAADPPAPKGSVADAQPASATPSIRPSTAGAPLSSGGPHRA